MRAFSGTYKKTRSLMFAVAMLGIGAGSVAQELTITSNQVAITQSSGGFSTTPTISNLGVVGDVTGVPVVASINVPIFTFTLEGGSGVADGAYAFNAGVVIKDVNSSRRLEIQVPTLTLNFASGTLSGTVASGSSIVLGRDAGGGTQVRATIADDGATTITNGTVSFNAASTLSDINAGGGSPLNDIIATVNAGGSYTYTIVLKQTSNLGNILRFSTKSGSENIHLPRLTAASCDSGYSLVGGATTATSSEFVLTAGGSIASSFDNGYALQGRFAVNASPIAGTLGNIGITCKTTVASGGGGGTVAVDPVATATVTAAANTITDEPNLVISAASLTSASDEQKATILADFTSSIETTVTANVDANLAGITTGAVSPTASLALLTSVVGVSDSAKNMIAAGIQVSAATINSITINAAKIIGALRGKTLSTAELDSLKATLSSTTNNTNAILAALRGQFGFLSTDSSELSVSAITSSTAVADISSIVANLDTVINNGLGVPGIGLTNTLFTETQTIAQTSAELLFGPLGTQLGLSVGYTTDSAVQDFLRTNAVFLDRLLGASAVEFGNASTISSSNAQAALENVGLSTNAASTLAVDLTEFVRTDDLFVDTGSGSQSISTSLSTMLAANSLSAESTTGLVNYSKDGANYAIRVSSVHPASVAIPDGDYLLDDGSRLLVQNELAIVLVPSSLDITAFAAAIENVGSGAFTTEISTSGAIQLVETSSSIVFSANFSDDAIESVNGTGALTFEAPTGDAAATGYVFTVQHADGSRQALSPALVDNTFFDSVANAGFAVTTDRSTGVIQIAGFNFKPDYFQLPLTTVDSTYLDANKDSAGVAYRALNANGDGVTDYQVITSTGTQIVYGQP